MGNYDVQIIDGNGCIQEYTFSVNQPDNLFFTYQTNQQIVEGECNGSEIGSIDVTINGGVPPYELTLYQIINNVNFAYEQVNGNDSLISFNNLEGGNFSLLLEDSGGSENCYYYEDNILIIEPEILEISASIWEDNCCGYNTSCFNTLDGEIQLSTNNGGTPFVDGLYQESELDSEDEPVQTIVTDDSGGHTVQFETVVTPTEGAAVAIINDRSVANYRVINNEYANI